MDHRDTMNTERRSSKRTTWERHSGAGGFPWSVRGRVVPVPEGLQRRLAGGKSAPADAAPGNGAEWLRAPAGHRRNGPGCWPIAGGPIGPRRRVVTVRLRDRRRQTLLRCPAGAWPVRRGNRGPRPLARACPRLISCGVPPGPKARRRRQFSRGLMVASATAKSARRARILQSCSTEKTRNSPTGIGPLIRDFQEPMPSPPFLCVHRVSVVLLPFVTASLRLSIATHLKNLPITMVLGA